MLPTDNIAYANALPYVPTISSLPLDRGSGQGA